MVITISIAFVFSRANGHFDPFYKRFTSTKQSSLILGSSRSAQGLVPSVFNNRFHKKLYNYSFTYNTCPFGPTYLKSIKSKVNEQSKNGMFIISVDPWTISSSGLNPNDSLQFDESEMFLGKVTYVNSNPNLLYLIKGYSDMYVKMLFTKSPYFLHDDGWLEVNIDINAQQLEKDLNETIKNYTKKLVTYNYSKVRLDYLKKTILYLKKYGTVYLVRLPIDSNMEAIEKQLIPDFDAKILKLSKATSVNYINLLKDNTTYNFSDGHHLTKPSAFLVSEKVANFIENIEVVNQQKNEIQ
ncbi:hypothetical protein APS56_09080 [Pseudalgibacter alginicilyticus]|uniref:SGNH domain-containing protein n=2 Tax=Pseudalgibacter alginicilyticus TaxID=1736674 RepID=A0A0P0CGF1_9FLAO|nr:hypothetical protein APS56_09080 [Pseudalgibacter alginicilyticus]